MRPKDTLWPVLLVGLLGFACAFPLPWQSRTVNPSPLASTQAPVRTQPTASPTPLPSPTSSPAPSPTPKPTQKPPNLDIVQLYLRYDSQQPEGTFEVTVCNTGPRSFTGTLEVTFEANGVIATVTKPFPDNRRLLVNRCVDLFPEVGFSHFGIAQPGAVDVTVRVGLSGGDALQIHQERLTIRDLTPQPTEEAWQRYQECMEKYGQYVPSETACLDRLPDFPLAQRDEIAKRWGMFTAIASREYEDRLAPWLLVLRTCTPEVQRFLGIPQDFQVPFLVIRFDPNVPAIAVTEGATITMQMDSRDHEALMEISQYGCQPGKLRSFTGEMLVHEIVHVLINLYVEDEWHGAFYDLMLDDGTYIEGEYPEYIDLLPTSLDEGLAYWTRAQFVAEPGILDWQCTSEGLVDRPTQERIPYMPLDLQSPDEIDQWVRRNLPEDSVMAEVFEALLNPEYFWRMGSAQCFWDTLVTMEGREVIGKVLTRLREDTRKDTCDYPFVDVALAPVVSPDTLQEVAKRVRVRRGVSACAYE